MHLLAVLIEWRRSMVAVCLARSLYASEQRSCRTTYQALQRTVIVHSMRCHANDKDHLEQTHADHYLCPSKRFRPAGERKLAGDQCGWTTHLKQSTQLVLAMVLASKCAETWHWQSGGRAARAEAGDADNTSGTVKSCTPVGCIISQSSGAPTQWTHHSVLARHYASSEGILQGMPSQQRHAAPGNQRLPPHAFREHLQRASGPGSGSNPMTRHGRRLTTTSHPQHQILATSQ